MALIRGKDLHLHFGHGALLDNASFVIHKGQHIGLVGRNGEGKSSFLRCLNGEIKLDKGELQFDSSLTIRLLDQEVPEKCDKRIFDVVAEGLGPIAKTLNRYQILSQKQNLNDEQLKELQYNHQCLDDMNGWGLLSQVEAALTKMSLPSDKQMTELSGGMRRRVLLAQCLLAKPDVLLLDEPTNHLDIEAIEWLESLITQYSGTVLIVSHDRAFLDKTVTDIIDIDRGRLTLFNGGYQSYLKQKENLLNAIAKEEKNFDKKLADEEIWIRQGIKARRTRNEGRVRALKAMRLERQKRRQQKGTMTLSDGNVNQSGKVVFEAQDVHYQIDGNTIISGFSTTVLRGDKIGIVGPNGCGKTTLLKLLLGDLCADSGTVKRGTNLNIAYFDQLRSQIDGDKTVMDVVGEGSQKVNVFGVEKHIISYLNEFLFSPDRCRSPVRFLSGGEKNRLLLARLFTRNANVFVFDEPTNDLDIESLEMLESFLVTYQGTLLIVSHDRVFLDNVTSSIWLYEGHGHFNEYVGGYSDAFKESQQQQVEVVKKTPMRQEPENSQGLSAEEKRELKRLPKKIDETEKVIQLLEEQLADPMLYQSDNDKAVTLSKQLREKEQELEALFERWQHLEELGSY